MPLFSSVFWYAFWFSTLTGKTSPVSYQGQNRKYTFSGKKRYFTAGLKTYLCGFDKFINFNYTFNKLANVRNWYLQGLVFKTFP